MTAMKLLILLFVLLNVNKLLATLPCEIEGKFQHPNDPLCTQYYICLLQENGFNQTIFVCPDGERFDPDLNECSASYKCFPKKKIMECDVQDKDDFVCNETGRYRKLDDRSCTKYYLCVLIEDNSFIKIEYSCPLGYYFDLSERICSQTYHCPCKEENTTTEIYRITEVTIPTRTSLSTIYTLPRMCESFPNKDKKFICEEIGTFADMTDVTCATYFQCDLLRNGSYLQTKYTCPLEKRFNPELKMCTELYECTCPQSKIITSEPTFTNLITTECLTLNKNMEEYNCIERGRFYNPKDLTCTKYFLCSLLRNGSFIKTEYTCPDGSYFDPELHLCSILYQCPCPPPKTTTISQTTTISTTTSSECLALQEDLEEFVCSERGRFFNPKDLTCTKYFLCSLLRNGSFIQTEYGCPDGSYFDPELHLCSILFQCSCPPPETTTISQTTAISTTTSSECLALQEDLEEFVCSERGRFFNPKDLTCTKYFLCSLLRNGSFIQTEYGCPDGSYFDPELHLCSILFQCPCPPPETTTISQTTAISTTTSSECLALQEDLEEFVCSERGRFFNPKDLTCTKYFLCSLLRNGSFIQTEYGCPDGSYFDPELHLCSILYQCPCPPPETTTISQTTAISTTTSSECLALQEDLKEFVCSERGRFFNPKDLTCTKYFLCSLLRNGSFIQTEYGCPDGSYFDPELHLCSILFQCSCPPPETTTISQITAISTTTSSECLALQEDLEEFVCSERGRFFNPKDLTCTKYFLCSLLRNGSFIQTEYGCPDGSYFDPELHLCSILFQCPCPPPETTTISQTTAISTTTSSECLALQEDLEEFVCSERGRFFNPKDLTCTKYFLCSLLRNGSFIQTEYGCPDGSYFDPELHLCSILFQCPCPPPETTTISQTTAISTTTFSECLALQEDLEEFVCSERGRFFNPKDLTCTKYFLCSLLRNGSFIQTEYGCPDGSYFDPELHLCSILYQCPCPPPETTTISQITAISTTTSSECLALQEDLEEFVCSERGRFFNPKDLTCTKYFLCSLLRNGSFIQTEYGCPDGSYFDPELHLCSILFQCPCPPPETTTISQTTAISTTTSSECLALQEDLEEFVCSERGRFFNPKDLTCTKYFLCSLLRNGSFIQTEYGCPDGSYFDPELHLCSILFQCPCPPPETTTISQTTAISTTTSSECLALQEDLEEFVCSERGRFFNPKDLTCTKYFLCSLLRNGSFIQTEYGCPDGSYFDPELHLCSILYQCPCPPPETTTISQTTAISTTTSSECLALQEDLEEFVCSERGRFFNPKDLTCTKYFLCSLLRNGSFIQTEYGCPDGSYFDPELHLCSILYQCPCPPPETTTISQTTAISTTTSSECLALQEDLEEFVCSERGRFFNPKDLTCTKYFLCSLLRNGSFIQTEYGCPDGSYFDPELHLCSILYQCPCPPPETTMISQTTAISTTTSSECLALQEDLEEFVCSERGRFFNPKDLTCTKYFLCSLLRNGSFIQTEYGCPDGSYFDPELHLCSILYQCPCPPPETTTISQTTAISTTTSSECLALQEDLEEFVCSERGRFFNPKDLTCTKYFLCSLLRNGSFIQTEYGCPDGSYFDPELHLCSILYQCPCPPPKTTTISQTTTISTTTSSECLALQEDLEEFVCSERGRFFNPKDLTCTKYFLCSLLRNGSFIQTEYGCPDGSYFDPELHLCSILYQCPCPPPETTTISQTTAISTTTSSECIALQEDLEEFVCSERGRFFNPKDLTCTKYFLCSLLRNGSFIQTEYGCPDGSYFDPELHLCSILYQCPCPPPETTTISQTTAISTTTSSECLALQEDLEEFVCSERGRFFNPKDLTCTKYFLCSLLRNGSFIQTEYGCPDGSYFDPELHLCSISYKCPCPSPETTAISQTTAISTTTSSECLALQEDLEEFVCSERGRFFNPKDLTCTKYFLCSLLRNGSFIQTEYGCPDGSYFDPELHLCSILYQCPCPPPETTTISQTTAISTTTSSECQALQEDLEEFVCSERGRFFNPKDLTCTKYFLCSLLRNGSFIQTEYGCPDGSYFDPELHLCSILYQCPCPPPETTTISQTTAISTTTSSECLALQEDLEEFVCSERGRFFNPRDLTCTKYFLCSLLRNGSFIQTEYGCPDGSYFDPELHLCSILYKCPCPSPETTTISQTTAISTTTSSECLALQEDLEEFVCSERGRFFNPRDLTCTKYFLCSLLRNGSFMQTEYGCPDGSYFDPELHLCSILYKCPCPSPETTTISQTTTIFTTTSSQCLALQEDLEEFVCSERGQFFNPKDLTCTKYFLCSLLRNGSFIQTEYGCPDGSYFDPKLHLCSILYKCPCLSPETPTTIPSTTQYLDSLTTSLTTSSDCLANQDNVEKFICSERGRFFDPTDSTCTKYFLCSLLQNGSLIQTQYICPLGSYFDPQLHLCRIMYQCPCSPVESSTTTKSSIHCATLIPSTVVDLSSTTIKKTIMNLFIGTERNSSICSGNSGITNQNNISCKNNISYSLLQSGANQIFLSNILIFCILILIFIFNIKYRCPCNLLL